MLILAIISQYIKSLLRTFISRQMTSKKFGGTGVSPVQTQAKSGPCPIGASPEGEIHCRGGSRAAPTAAIS
jgi:hypothetical protein